MISYYLTSTLTPCLHPGLHATYLTNVSIMFIHENPTSNSWPMSCPWLCTCGGIMLTLKERLLGLEVSESYQFSQVGHHFHNSQRRKMTGHADMEHLDQPEVTKLANNFHISLTQYILIFLSHSPITLATCINVLLCKFHVASHDLSMSCTIIATQAPHGSR